MCAIVATALTTGCANIYVDTAIGDVAPNAIRQPEAPEATQLIFEFQTKGTGNAAATGYLKNQVFDLVRQSGMFSEVSETPVASNNLLSVVINNVELTKDAYAKGFVTGLTFGAAGSVVSDGYICTIEFQPGTTKTSIQKTVRHAIHTTLGAKGAPPNAVKAASADDAVKTMTRQIVDNGLKALSLDPAFNQP